MGNYALFFYEKEGENMTVTAQQVLDIAATLMDDLSDSGAILFEEPDNTKSKALSILTILQAELTTNPSVLTDLNQELSVSDKVALMVLPYGLAAHILIDNGDQNNASFFNSRYDELKRKQPARISPITDVYGINTD
jgi:hypothetical protein